MFGNSIIVNGIVEGDIKYKNIVCRNHMINKFQQDKLFAETDRYIILLDGVILNQRDLLEKQDKTCWQDTILRFYEQRGERFFDILRGSFAGALYDKQQDKWIIFGDQIGSKFVYYAKIGDFFCCSEVMGNMYELLRENKKNYHLNETGAFLLLTYGYMVDDITLCEEVHKINPGCYITYQNGKVEEHRYYMLSNQPDESILEDDAVELIDKYFRQAVVREFEKDKEYGYQHLVALSGGLDCRMTSFVAHNCGYEKQLNMTFSQTGYWDQTLPMKMAADMKHEWIYKALDNGMWLYDVDEITRTNAGNVLYYGNAHGNSLLKYINFKKLGAEHTGQIGDVILSSFITAADKEKRYKIGQKAYSEKFIDKLGNLKLGLDLDKEMGLFYYRAFNGTNNGIQCDYNYTEVLSPFLDIDLMEKALSIPIELREKHKIYIKWILAKYPQAAKYVWQTTGEKITRKPLKIGNKEIPWSKIPQSIKWHLRSAFGLSNEGTDSLNHMNPIAYYLKHNTELMEYLNGYFNYIEAIPNEDIRKIVVDIQKTGKAMEKIEAVSLLAAVKMFYI